MPTEYLDTDIGLVKIEADEIGITKISIVEEEGDPSESNKHTLAASEQLAAYFRGELTDFNLTYNLEGGPPFHLKVWKILQSIPFGRTTSYLEIAKKLGDPNSTRAVGMANGKNPIAIVIPCHRVIGSNGSLTGYAYGTAIKRKLLALENPKEYAINGQLF